MPSSTITRQRDLQKKTRQQELSKARDAKYGFGGKLEISLVDIEFKSPDIKLPEIKLPDFKFTEFQLAELNASSTSAVHSIYNNADLSLFKSDSYRLVTEQSIKSGIDKIITNLDQVTQVSALPAIKR